MVYNHLVISCFAGGVEHISKSYPHFFAELQGLGVEIREQNPDRQREDEKEDGA